MLKRLSFYLIISLILYSSIGLSQTDQKTFKDSIDGAFDISHYLYDLHGLLPVISPITEPAVGYGAAAALLYFIPKKDVGNGEFRMPDIVAGVGGYTSNNTWFAGVGYIGYWKKDAIRYRGIFAYADVKLKYYGKSDSPLGDKPISFNMNTYIFLQQAVFRIKKSSFFIGSRYLFSNSTVILFDDKDLPWLDPLDIDLISSGISLITEFENFNNVLSPTKGMRFHLDYDQNLELIGSDRDYGRLTFYSHLYFPVGKSWVPAFRVESQMSTGAPPFYALPYVRLRGVPALRYQGELTFLVETEHYFAITPRWGMVGFTGIGTTYDNLEDMNRGDIAWNAGAGFRYMIARALGLKMGIDIARGPEDWAIYVVFGHSWLK